MHLLAAAVVLCGPLLAGCLEAGGDAPAPTYPDIEAVIYDVERVAGRTGPPPLQTTTVSVHADWTTGTIQVEVEGGAKWLDTFPAGPEARLHFDTATSRVDRVLLPGIADITPLGVLAVTGDALRANGGILDAGTIAPIGLQWAALARHDPRASFDLAGVRATVAVDGDGDWDVRGVKDCGDPCLNGARSANVRWQGRHGELLPRVAETQAEDWTIRLTERHRLAYGANALPASTIDGTDAAPVDAAQCEFIPCEDGGGPPWLSFQSALAEVRRQADWASFTGHGKVIPFALQANRGQMSARPEVQDVSWALMFMRSDNATASFHLYGPPTIGGPTGLDVPLYEKMLTLDGVPWRNHDVPPMVDRARLLANAQQALPGATLSGVTLTGVGLARLESGVSSGLIDYRACDGDWGAVQLLLRTGEVWYRWNPDGSERVPCPPLD